MFHMEVSKNEGPVFGSPHNKDHLVLWSLLAAFVLETLIYHSMIWRMDTSPP